MSEVTVVFHSISGNTRKMAEAIGEGARSTTGTEVQVKEGLEATVEDFVQCDGSRWDRQTTSAPWQAALRISSTEPTIRHKERSPGSLAFIRQRWRPTVCRHRISPKNGRCIQAESGC